MAIYTKSTHPISWGGAIQRKAAFCVGCCWSLELRTAHILRGFLLLS